MCKRCFDFGRVHRKGFTLIELLVTITIMGILSTLGVAGLQGAVENNRVNGAARGMAAFLEQVANESNRLSAPICLTSVSGNDRRIEAYQAEDCSKVTNDQLVTSFELEAPMKLSTGCGFTADDCDATSCPNWLSTGVFKPKLGLSAAPAFGYLCAQYGDNAHYAAAMKETGKNTITPMVGDEEGWEEL